MIDYVDTQTYRYENRKTSHRSRGQSNYDDNLATAQTSYEIRRECCRQVIVVYIHLLVFFVYFIVCAYVCTCM